MARFSFQNAIGEVRARATSLKRVLLIGLASLLLALSTVGTFIPLFPARLIAAPALLIFSVYSPTAYASITRWLQRYPRIQSWFDKVRNWAIHRLR